MSKIWDYDCYDLRKFKPGEIDFFLDIGANVGTVSLQAKVLLPKAKVISLEPARDTFEILERNMQQWKSTGIKLYNVALGDGSLMSFHRKGKAGSGMNRFYNQDEKDKWRKNYEYEIESKTIKQIFEDYKIDVEKKYIIKIDCEGGERFLLNDDRSIDIIKNSECLSMEIHFLPVKIRNKKFKNYEKFKTFPKWEIYREWMYDNFEKTHKIICNTYLSSGLGMCHLSKLKKEKNGPNNF